jgi:3-phenylpropionate/cinnamic acid dioxygenase small subunit
VTTVDATRTELWLEVSQFLYREAALIDGGRFRDWLDLFTDDAVYWVPQADGEDPERFVSIAYDDRRRLGERVLRLESGFAHAQDPPSRTCHLVGNVVLGAEEDGELPVSSSLLVAEVRRAVQTLYAARVEHRLTRADSGALSIRRKVVRLINSDAPLGNVSFLL